MDWTGLAADVLTGGSLVAVVIIGTKSLRVADAATRASQDAANATKGVLTATWNLMATTEAVGRQSAEDARVRRLEAVLEVVLEMRELFNDQHSIHDKMWVPGYGTPEARACLALMRRLEGRLVPTQLCENSKTWILTTTYSWASNSLEDAITEAKGLLRVKS